MTFPPHARKQPPTSPDGYAKRLKISSSLPAPDNPALGARCESKILNLIDSLLTRVARVFGCVVGIAAVVLCLPSSLSLKLVPPP